MKKEAKTCAMHDIREWLRSEDKAYIPISSRRLAAINEVDVDDCYASVRDFGYGYTLNPQI